MKKLSLSFLFLILVNLLFAQEKVEESLAEAKSAYDSEDLQSTRFALEEALRELDVVIGYEILKILPEAFDDYSFKKEEDMVMGISGGLVGLSIERNYYLSEDVNDNIILVIMNDSPMLSIVNSFLTNSMIMSMTDSDQKVVRVNGYKALLTKETNDDNSIGYQIQIPFGNSLLTLDCEKIGEQEKIMSFAEAIDVKAISHLAGSN